MMRPSDPRIRQTINRFSHNLESANETAQEGLYTFSQNYVSPCFASIGNSVRACTATCFPSREDQLRRRRRGQNAEAVFDFYDDWDNEADNEGLLGWGNGELDRLLAGSGLTRGHGVVSEQPRRQRKISYGTRNVRGKSGVKVPDERNDPTVIPRSSILGFLERLPWRIRGRGLKYRPSAADLQVNPHSLRRHTPEDEPLMEQAEESEDDGDYTKRASRRRNNRDRSETQSSRETHTSLSSRADLILSEEEEDAVPLDDEFAMTLGHRGTAGESDDILAGKPEPVKRSASGTLSLGASSSRGSRGRKKRSHTSRSKRFSDVDGVEGIEVPSMMDLKKEEEQAAQEEESEIARKRAAAQRLAASRGLDRAEVETTQCPAALSETNETASDERNSAVGLTRSSSPASNRQLPRTNSYTEPFPPLPTAYPSNTDVKDSASARSQVVSDVASQSTNGHPEPDGITEPAGS